MNAWCNFAHHEQCSFAGVYQPDLPPPGDYGEFYGFGNFEDLWKFLGAKTDSMTVAEMYEKGKQVCAMDWVELNNFNNKKKKKKRESR